MTGTLTLLFIASYLAFSLSAICGGGAGLILIPILGNLMPVNQVPAALSIGTFSSSASRLVVFYRQISWTVVKWFVPAAVPAVWLGACLLKYSNPLYLQFLLGLFLVSNLFFLLRKSKDENNSRQPLHAVLIIIGAIAGFLSGLTGAVGLLFNRFYFRYNLTEESIVVTRAANEILLHIIKIILYFFFGLLSVKILLVGIMVAVAGVLSTLTMKYILPRISDTIFKKVGYTAMVISGVVMLTQSGNALAAQNNARLSSNRVDNGMEMRLKWQRDDYAFEFTYDKGFEFEQEIPFAELTHAQQQKVVQHLTANKIEIEVVHTFSATSYEAYYYVNGELTDKLKFE